MPCPFLSSNSVCCRHSKAPFTFIMQIMFGNPSLSLTFSWAAPTEDSEFDFQLQPIRSLASNPDLSSNSNFAVDETELLDKPFELTLARY